MKTPLYDLHAEAGARMFDFEGWRMPLYYTGIIEEHGAVRRRAGIFDLSHMGRIRIGTGAFRRMQEEISADAAGVSPGSARYSLVCGDTGGIVDDIVLYNCRDSFLVVANAANSRTVFEQLSRGSRGGQVKDVSEETAMIAVQGPRSETVAARVFGDGIVSLRPGGFSEFKFGAIPLIISRTGYTGEDGFEMYIEAGQAGGLWRKLIAEGGPSGLKPAGLGARDILRLEAGFPLYGNELDSRTNPFEAGLGRAVDFSKKKFRGRKALLKLKNEQSRKLKGFVSGGKCIPRRGCVIFSGSIKAGEVTSGSYSPVLGKTIGMAYLDADFSGAGTVLEAEVRGRRVGIELADLPFYRRPRAKK